MDLTPATGAAAGPEGQALWSRLRGTGERLTLVGAPAAIGPWVAAARAAGFVRVALAIGPEGLGAEGLAQIRAAGVDELHATLFAADAAAHDYHTGAAGSLRATVTTLRAARAARVPAVVTTPISRSNARVLPALPGLLADAGVGGWRVVVPAIAGAFAARFDALAPRLAVALPSALQAIAAAERAGVPAGIEGAPLCLLGPLRGRSLPARARAYAAGCEGCAGRAACPGVDPAYLRRFAGDELSPRALRAGEDERKGQVLGRMFSGPWLEVQEGACTPI